MRKKTAQPKANGPTIYKVSIKENGYRERYPWRRLLVGDRFVVPLRPGEERSKVRSNLALTIIPLRRTSKKRPDKNGYFVGETPDGVVVMRVK